MWFDDVVKTNLKKKLTAEIDCLYINGYYNDSESYDWDDFDIPSKFNFSNEVEQLKLSFKYFQEFDKATADDLLGFSVRKNHKKSNIAQILFAEILANFRRLENGIEIDTDLLVEEIKTYLEEE